jgi:hypothetical protein
VACCVQLDVIQAGQTFLQSARTPCARAPLNTTSGHPDTKRLADSQGITGGHRAQRWWWALSRLFPAQRLLTDRI